MASSRRPRKLSVEQIAQLTVSAVNALAQLLDVNRTTISRAIRDTLPLLDQHPSAIPEPATARIHTLADLHVYATARVTTPASEIKPAC